MSRKKDADLAMMQSVYQDALLSREFQREILYLRKIYGIPQEGFPEKRNAVVPPPFWADMHAARRSKAEPNNLLLDRKLFGNEPHEEWDEYWMDLAEEISTLGATFGLFFPFQTAHDPLAFYVFYNRLPNDSELTIPELQKNGFCINVAFLEQPPSPNDLLHSPHALEINKKRRAQRLQDKNSIYPVVLRISAFASQDDIVEYLRRNYRKLIIPELKEARIRFGIKGRKRSRRLNPEAKSFIVTHRRKAHLWIREQVKERFGLSITQPEIASIIAKNRLLIEKKRAR